MWYFNKKLGYHSSNHPKSHNSTSSITSNSEATILLSLENPPRISMMFRRLLGFHQSKSHQITNHGLTSYTFRVSEVFLLCSEWILELWGRLSVRASPERFRCCWCWFPSYLRWCPMIALGMDGRQTTNCFASWWITNFGEILKRWVSKLCVQLLARFGEILSFFSSNDQGIFKFYIESFKIVILTYTTVVIPRSIPIWLSEWLCIIINYFWIFLVGTLVLEIVWQTHTYIILISWEDSVQVAPPVAIWFITPIKQCSYCHRPYSI